MNRFSYRLSSLASIGASRLTGFFYLLFSCFILSSIGFSQGPDWYVSTDGDDSNDGSQGSPYATIQMAFSQVESIGNLNEPQTIYISSGTYVENISLNTDLNGEMDVMGSIFFVSTEEERFGAAFLSLLADKIANMMSLSKSISYLLEK